MVILMARQGKQKERTFENVKAFWDNEGKELGNTIYACIRDNEFRKLEIQHIIKYITGKQKVLDLACGNGYCTIYFSQHVGEIIGTDYSEPLIKSANNLLKNFPEKDIKIDKNIRFEVANALDLPYKDESFDVVIAERLLVNLPEVELQEKAVKEIYRVLKPGGLYIFSEATFQGHDNLNHIRGMFGLSNMERHWHNLYIDETSFMPFIKRYFNIIDSRRFGLYHFLSKVIHPLIVAPEEPKFDSKINIVARTVTEKMPKIEELEKSSHHLCIVFQKV